MTKYEEDTKIMHEYNKIKVKCKYCGHINTIPVFLDNKPCGNCKKILNNNTKAWFKYKMRNILG